MESGTLIADRYRLDNLIAWGGMGAVWRGFDTRLDREVGVKILRQGLEEAQNPHERFEREAKTLAGLKGPGFVEIYDYGADSDGGQAVLFIVMELVEGASLAELLHSEERLGADRAMRIVAEAAEALEAAHRAGIVHRDVKPANILLDEAERVRVIDFGISQLSKGPKLTSTDAVLGTASYVSPEQLRRGEVTGAADQYALGAVAYECLTGAPPFDSIDREAITHGHLHDPPLPLPEDVPAAVAAAVLRSLQKAPEDRWESAGAMARACRAAIESEPSPAPAGPPTLKQRPAGLWSWRFGFVTVAVVTLLLLTGLFAFSPWDGFGGTQAEDPTGAAEEVASEEQSPEGSSSTDESEASEEETPEDAPEDGGDEPDSDGGEDDAETDVQEDTGGDEEADDPPAGGSAEVPDVRGMTTFEARDVLAAAGFENAAPEVGYYWITPEPEHCTVIQHWPEPGSTADRSEEIRLSYHERQAEGTSCEW